MRLLQGANPALDAGRSSDPPHTGASRPLSRQVSHPARIWPVRTPVGWRTRHTTAGTESATLTAMNLSGFLLAWRRLGNHGSAPPFLARRRASYSACGLSPVCRQYSATLCRWLCARSALSKEMPAQTIDILPWPRCLDACFLFALASDSFQIRGTVVTPARPPLSFRPPMSSFTDSHLPDERPLSRRCNRGSMYQYSGIERRYRPGADSHKVNDDRRHPPQGGNSISA
jgi:hypothetical protein